MSETRHHARNTTFLGLVEAFWGLGMNVLSMGTILPVFLLERGASNSVIAFLPALSALGAGLPQVLSGLVAGRRSRLKPLVLWLHVASPAPLVLTGFLLLWGRLPTVPVVLALWACFYAAIGLLFPIWLDYMAKILDPARRGGALGIVFLTQTVAGAIGVTLAGILLRGGTDDARYALLFFIGALAMAGGSFFFLGTREEPSEDVDEPALGVGQHLRDLIGLWRRLPWLRRYIVSRWFVRGSYPLLIHFYAVFAVAQKGVSPATAALYGTAALACQAMAGGLAGVLGDRLGHKASVLLGQGGLLVACLLVVSPLPNWAFFAVAGLTGGFLATEYTNQAAWVMDLAGPSDRRSVLALGGFLLTPASVLTPLLGGWLMDRTGFRPVVGGVAVIIVAAMVLVAFTVPARNEVCEEASK